MIARIDAHYPVIIVGAGPVGLALACELGLAGIDCLQVEKRDGTVHVPKMSLVCAGTMEIARRWGIAQQVRSAVWAQNRAMDFLYIESLKGEEYARVKLPAYDAQPPSWTPEGLCHCPQIYFDPILSKRVDALPSIARRYNVGLDRFAHDDTGVTAHLSDSKTGAQYTVRADYLIGCDGPNGVVRDGLGIGLEGRGAIANSINIFFRSPELSKCHDKGWGRIYRVIDDTGCWAELIPIDGDRLWRLTVFDDPKYVEDPDSALHHMMGGAFPYEIISTLPWERRDFVAASYGQGRVFIAGDAAHQSSPTGGVGMHTGIEDAVNLAWKIAAMLAGWGGAELLKTYEIERKPIAERNVALSTDTYDAIARIPGKTDQQHKAVGDWRDDMAPLSIPDIIRCRYRYANSPIIHGESGPGDIDLATLTHPATPGWRLPHVWLDERRSTLDLIDNEFTLLRIGDDAPRANALATAAEARNVPLNVETISAATASHVFPSHLVLVRPDRHIAWVGDRLPADLLSLVDQVRGAVARTKIE